VLLVSWRTVRDRWQVFVGSVVTVCLGVALVQASLLTLISAATAEVPAGLTVAEDRALRTGYTFATVLLAEVLGVSAFVAVFVVSSTFAFTVAQRRRDLALLRLNGASRRQLRLLLLGEAVLLGLAGSVLGVGLGVLVMRLLVRMLDGFGFVPPGFVGGWRWWIVAVSVGAGTGVAVCGVLAASARASRVRPLDALRETGDAARVMTGPRWAAGALAVTGGLAMAAAMPFLRGEAALNNALLMLFTLVIAAAALGPLVVPAMSRPLGPVFPGVLGRLAHANLRAGVRRSASTAAPVMVLVAFVAGISGITATLGAGARADAHRTMRADLVVTADHPLGPDLARVDGVATVSEEVPVTLDVSLDASDPSAYDIADALAVDPTTYARTHLTDVTAGDLPDLRGATAAVSPGYSPGMNWRVGDTLRVRLDGEPRDLRIVALLADTLAGPVILLPLDLAPAGGERRYSVRLADGADPSAVETRMAAAGVAGVSTAGRWIDDNADRQQRGDVNVMIALLALAMTYTVVAMINAVVVSTSERGGEFATARVTGLTRGQVVGTALWESLAVAATGLILGGLAAAATVLSMTLNIRATIGVTVLSAPWPVLGAVAAGSTLVVCATTVVTTLATTRTPPVRVVVAHGNT
jgi:putative ABC transport system permease protein